MAVPEPTMRVLFVCTGNTCRSPMAAAWFQRLCREQGATHIEIDSAGLATRPKDAVSPQARRVLEEEGLVPLRLRSQLLSVKIMHRADLILTMTASHCEQLVARFPSAANKTRPLLSVLAPRHADVFDPYGGSTDDYRRCLAMMKPALEAVLDRIR